MVAMVDRAPAAAIDRESVLPKSVRVRTNQALPPARLTRRGRIVVTGVSALIVGALSVGLASAAQAAHAGQAAPGRHVAKVMVRPGQSLWSLAETYDPHADPRLIVEQVQQLNSMPGAEVKAGQVLWVPRG
jgi:LysM domain